MMKLLFGVLLAGHGLIHLFGVAKAFGMAAVPQLSQPISMRMGAAWLAAALLLLVAALSLLVWPRWWWVIGAVACAVSKAVIVSSWSDAKYGTVVNAILLIGAVYGYLSLGPFSFRAEYEHAVEQGVAQAGILPFPADADLGHLPKVVQKYLRVTGVAGLPRASNVSATFRGEIRGGPAEPWMEFTAEQFNTFGAQPSRYFFMQASKAGVPFEALHVFAAGSASMRVKLASLVTVVDARGPELDRAETVTVLNDMFLLAPSTLATSAIVWDQVDTRSARATFSNAGQTVSAIAAFAESGELIGFDSDDRLRSSSDGKTFTRTRWTTPVGQYRSFGPLRMWSTGEARWHPTEGGFAYGRFELRGIEYNNSKPGWHASAPTAKDQR